MYHQTNPTELFRERQLALLAEAQNRRLLVRRVRARRAPKATRTIAANPSYLLAAFVVAGLLALIALAAEPAHAALPGTNGKIVFHSYRKNNDDIYAMNPNGTGLQRLTRNPAWDGEPVVSPDGKKVVFESFRDGNKEIYIMNADGSQQKRLTYNAAYDDSPVFSPDGKKIAFLSNRDTTPHIYKMNADGSNQKPVSNRSGYTPDWGSKP